MYHLYQIEVYAVDQDKICVKISIGHLVVSYLQSTKQQVVYVAAGCRLRLWAFLQLFPCNSYACCNIAMMNRMAGAVVTDLYHWAIMSSTEYYERDLYLEF